MILKGYIYSVLYATLCLIMGLCLYKLRVDKKITRKLVHILVGFEWIILYRFFGGGVNILVVCLLFLTILWVAHKKRLMPMIESDGDNSPGTVYYALAMSIMALVTIFVPDMIISFGIGVFCTSLGDGLAGLVGQCVSASFNKRIYGNKTIVGAVVNFGVSLCVVLLFNTVFSLGISVPIALAIALFVTELELFSSRGLDNISVTLGSASLSYLAIKLPMVEHYLLPILLTPLIIAFAYKKRALTRGGIIAAFFIGLAVSVSLGNIGFAILFGFFVGGIIFDKIKKRYKKIGQSEEIVEKKGNCRDHVQVLCNGLCAAILAILYFAFDERIFLIGYIASLSEALSDTAASGIGALSKSVYDPIRRTSCAPGLSGGMSIIGTVAALVTALIIPAVLLSVGYITFSEMAVIALCAFLGSLLDSILGSLIQVKYKCTLCEKVVEREEHCGLPTVKHSGITFVTNDAVNLISTLFSSALSILLSL